MKSFELVIGEKYLAWASHVRKVKMLPEKMAKKCKNGNFYASLQ